MQALKTSLRKQVNDILLDISWAQLSKNYFGKSRSWLNHKINGIDSNGKPTEISEEEVAQIKEALLDLSSRIKRCAEEL
jgi:hypothetical protein